MGQKPIEGSNPSLSATVKSQLDQEPAGELGQKEKSPPFSTASLLPETSKFLFIRTTRAPMRFWYHRFEWWNVRREIANKI